MALPAPAHKVEDAILDYLSGESCKVASARHGVSERRVRTALVERGQWRTLAESRRIAGEKRGALQRAANWFDPEAIAAAHESGESVKAIADRLGVSRSVIGIRLREAGVTPRGQLETNRQMAAARTPEEKWRNVQAAHAAMRGSTRSWESKLKAALTIQEQGRDLSPLEAEFVRIATPAGLSMQAQTAIGPYNADFTAGAVAVEIFGGGWHSSGRHARRAPERFEYILGQGWNLVIIWTSSTRWPLGPTAADYVRTFVQLASANPAMRGEYRVIWGDGQEVPRDGLNVNNLTFKPSRSGRSRARP